MLVVSFYYKDGDCMGTTMYMNERYLKQERDPTWNMPRKPHPENETETLLGITAAEDDIAERHVSEDGRLMTKF